MVARCVVLIVVLAVACSGEAADKVVKETFGSGGRTRTYSRAPGINKEVWTFLQKHRLADDPQFQRYDIKR